MGVERLNLCNVDDRYPVLAPVGDALSFLYLTFVRDTDCACCLAIRLLIVIVISILLGHFL